MRLIDADALADDMMKADMPPHDIGGRYQTGFMDARSMAIAASTIDPVKHGEWIKMSDADGVYWACSKCGEDIPRVAHYNPQFDLFPRLESIDRTNYCPNCGAKMDGGEG